MGRELGRRCPNCRRRDAVAREFDKRFLNAIDEKPYNLGLALATLREPVSRLRDYFEPAAAGRFAFDMDAAFGLLAKEPPASFRLG